MAFIDKKIILPDISLSEEYLKKFEEVLSKYTTKLADIINGGLKLNENVNCQVITIADTDTADTEIEQAHTLRRVPVGFIVINKDQSCDVYDSGTSWTSSYIYIKCNADNASIKILVF